MKKLNILIIILSLFSCSLKEENNTPKEEESSSPETPVVSLIKSTQTFYEDDSNNVRSTIVVDVIDNLVNKITYYNNMREAISYEKFTYDDKNLLIETSNLSLPWEDVNFNTKYIYDDKNRIISIIEDTGEITSFEYNSTNNTILSTNNTNASTLLYFLNENNIIYKVKNTEGVTIEEAFYDSENNVTSMIVFGKTLTYKYFDTQNPYIFSTVKNLYGSGNNTVLQGKSLLDQATTYGNKYLETITSTDNISDYSTCTFEFNEDKYLTKKSSYLKSKLSYDIEYTYE